MITTVIIFTLDTLSMSCVEMHTIVFIKKYVDNFFIIKNIFYDKNKIICVHVKQKNKKHT
jgi:hypothetical protein